MDRRWNAGRIGKLLPTEKLIYQVVGQRTSPFRRQFRDRSRPCPGNPDLLVHPAHKQQALYQKHSLTKLYLPGLRLQVLSAATHPLFFLLLYPRALPEVRQILPAPPVQDCHLIFLFHNAQIPKPNRNQERSRTRFCTLNSLHCRLLRRPRKDRNQRAVMLLATPA